MCLPASFHAVSSANILVLLNFLNNLFLFRISTLTWWVIHGLSVGLILIIPFGILLLQCPLDILSAHYGSAFVFDKWQPPRTPDGKKCMRLVVEPAHPATPQPSQADLMSMLQKISDEQAAMREDHAHEMASLQR